MNTAIDITSIVAKLAQAGGDPERLALATAEIQLAQCQPILSRALEVASIPHWVDAGILALCLGLPEPEAGALLQELRNLGFLEPSTLSSGWSVRPDTRSAFRARLFNKDRVTFLQYCHQVHTWFSAIPTPNCQVEALYHLVQISPRLAAQSLDALWPAWNTIEHLAVFQRLDAYLSEPLLSGNLFETAGHTESSERRAFHSIRARLAMRDPNPRRLEAARLFVSYSHADRKHLKVLLNFLQPMHRDGKIMIWCDLEIQSGDVWDSAIREQLEAADLFLMLVSASFVASRYIFGVEMEAALRRHRGGQAGVVPIILDHCPWKRTSLGALQAATTDGKPITDFKPRNKGWNEVEQNIFGRVAEVPKWNSQTHISAKPPT